MIRRALPALLFAAALLAADASAEVFDLVASMAAGLSEGNSAAFGAALSKSMSSRDQLIENVRAMVVQAEVKSAISRISDDGDDQKRTVVLDWDLALHRKGPDLQTENRHEAVTITAVREGKKWKVTSIAPESFFAPPNFH